MSQQVAGRQIEDLQLRPPPDAGALEQFLAAYFKALDKIRSTVRQFADQLPGQCLRSGRERHRRQHENQQARHNRPRPRPRTRNRAGDSARPSGTDTGQGSPAIWAASSSAVRGVDVNPLEPWPVLTYRPFR